MSQESLRNPRGGPSLMRHDRRGCGNWQELKSCRARAAWVRLASARSRRAQPSGIELGLVAGQEVLPQLFSLDQQRLLSRLQRAGTHPQFLAQHVGIGGGDHDDDPLQGCIDFTEGCIETSVEG